VTIVCRGEVQGLIDSLIELSYDAKGRRLDGYTAIVDYEQLKPVIDSLKPFKAPHRVSRSS